MREKSARISVGSFILRTRSLFSVETVARIRDIAEILERLPFSGIKVGTVHGPRYRTTFDMEGLLERARAELATEHPEQYKIFLELFRGYFAWRKSDFVMKIPSEPSLSMSSVILRSSPARSLQRIR